MVRRLQGKAAIYLIRQDVVKPVQVFVAQCLPHAPSSRLANQMISLRH